MKGKRVKLNLRRIAPCKLGMFVLVGGLSLVMTACGAPNSGAASDAYPTRPVDVIVPYPPGGGSDAIARALVDSVNASGDLEHELQIVNRDGGGGVVGTSEVLNAEPDGQTIAFAPEGPITLQPAVEDVPYEPLDMTPIMQITNGPVVIAVPGDSPYKTVEDLVAAAEKDPGEVGMGEGPLTYSRTVSLLEEASSGAEFKRVDFEGDAASTTAILGNNIDATMTQIQAVLPQHKAGKVRVLAVTSSERSEFLPDVPTLEESGYDVETGAVYAVFGPAGMPSDVVDQLTATFEKALASPEFTKIADAAGLPISPASGDELMTYFEERTEEAERIAESGGL